MDRAQATDLWDCSTWLGGPSPAVSKCISAVLLRVRAHTTHHAKGRRKLAVTRAHRACNVSALITPTLLLLSRFTVSSNRQTSPTDSRCL